MENTIGKAWGKISPQSNAEVTVYIDKYVDGIAGIARAGEICRSVEIKITKSNTAIKVRGEFGILTNEERERLELPAEAYAVSYGGAPRIFLTKKSYEEMEKLIAKANANCSLYNDYLNYRLRVEKAEKEAAKIEQEFAERDAWIARQNGECDPEDQEIEKYKTAMAEQAYDIND